MLLALFLILIVDGSANLFDAGYGVGTNYNEDDQFLIASGLNDGEGLPSFVSQISPQAKSSLITIYRNQSLNLNQVDQAVTQWAAQNGVTQQLNDFRANVTKVKTLVNMDIQNLQKVLPTIFSQLQQVDNDRTQTLAQQKQKQQQIINSIGPMSRQIVEFSLVRIVSGEVSIQKGQNFTTLPGNRAWYLENYGYPGISGLPNVTGNSGLPGNTGITGNNWGLTSNGWYSGSNGFPVNSQYPTINLNNEYMYAFELLSGISALLGGNTITGNSGQTGNNGIFPGNYGSPSSSNTWLPANSIQGSNGIPGTGIFSGNNGGFIGNNANFQG